jgi:hypothetical protein
MRHVLDIHGLVLSIIENVSLSLRQITVTSADQIFLGYCGSTPAAGSVLTTSGCSDTCIGNTNEYVSHRLILMSLYLITFIVWWCEPIVNV